MYYAIEDGPRILEFDGEEIGFSTSERRGSNRWIEFTLYKTSGDGQYVLSRVGASNVYHTPECRFARRARIEPVPWGQLEEGATPCHLVDGVADPCRPDPEDFPLVCPEPDKTWARAYREPEGVLQALMKPDKNGGGLFLTAVARRLLEDVGARDPAISGAHRVETVT